MRAQIAEREAQPELAARLLKWAVVMAPQVLEDELPHLLRLVDGDARDGLLAELVARAQSRDFIELKRLVFAALAARLAHAEPLRGPLEQVFSRDPALHTVWQAAGPAHCVGTGRAAGAGREVSLRGVRICRAKILLAMSRLPFMGQF